MSNIIFYYFCTKFGVDMSMYIGDGLISKKKKKRGYLPYRGTSAQSGTSVWKKWINLILIHRILTMYECEEI